MVGKLFFLRNRLQGTLFDTPLFVFHVKQG